MSTHTAGRIARLESAREAAHVRRFAAEAGAAGWPAPAPDDGTPDERLEARIAAACGLAPAEVRRLIAEDAAAFRRGGRFADLRLARLVPRHDGGAR